MKSYRYLHLDVFTDHLFGGNQLAVMLDARGLAPDTMQAIAKEMNFSETTFVLPAERADTDCRVRIFTPGDELPMAGHPTIGTAFALARAGAVGPSSSHVIFGLGVGPTDVELSWNGGDLRFAWMTQLNPTFSAPIADRQGLAASLRLPATALSDRSPAQVVSCGVPYVLASLATRRDVDQASLDVAAYEQFRSGAGLGHEVCVYLFSTEPAADGATAYSRMFGPSIGIGEDPATGSAAGPLGCYLVHHGLVAAEKAAALLSRQGVKMGRPSDIHIAIASSGGAISQVRVGGEAVVVGEGTLYV